MDGLAQPGGKGNRMVKARGMMGRLARSHIEGQIRDRFPGRDIHVEDARDGSLRIEIGGADQGTLIAICGDEPSTVLAGLLACPERDGQ